MVEQRLDAAFHALSDATRRGMLARLALGETSVGELAAPFDMTFAGASKHVKVLESAGLVARRKVGRMQMCRLRSGPLAAADRWLDDYRKLFEARFDALDDVLEDMKQEEANGSAD
jgi:DNA-binding transcriptional ArsR family regulator